MAWAQCNCGSCNSQLLGDCRTSDDWNNPFFNCCKIRLGEGEVCDPCCRLPYFSSFAGYTSWDSISRTESFVNPTIFNVIDDGTTIIDPGPPPVFSNYVAESVDTTIDREQGLILDDGYGLGGAIGYRVHRQFRLETEFSYRENDAVAWFVEDTTTTTTRRFTNPNFAGGTIIDQTVTTSRVEGAASGEIKSYSGMFNGIYDFSPPRIRCCNLYLGGGLGLSNVQGDVLTDTIAYQIDSTAFAYQLITGVNVPLSHNLEMFADYRFLGSSQLSIDDATNNVSLGQFDQTGTHNVFVGFRIYPRR